MFIIRFKQMTTLALALFSGLLNVSFFARAEHSGLEVTTRIQKMYNEGSEVQIFSTVDARVYSLSSKNLETIKQLEAALTSSEPIKLILADDKVIGVSKLSLEERAQFSDAFIGSADDTVRDLTEPQPNPTDALTYQPSTFDSTDDAENLFQNLDWNVNHDSQCYQRAHYWAYSMWNRSSVNSMKVFLFFTQKYIRAYNYKWWFHVAPYVYAGGMEMVLDPEFVRHTMQLDQWSHVFVRTRDNCQVASSYQEYEQGQYTYYCYVRKMPMYHYQPLDVQRADLNNTVRSNWVSWELNNSRCAKWVCPSPAPSPAPSPTPSSNSDTLENTGKRDAFNK